jgi:SAM-dependent methyltransferase
MCAGETFGTAELIACPICRAQGHRPVLDRPDALTVVECEDCHLYYVNPQPTQEALQRFYASGYFQGQHDFFQGHDYFAERDRGIRERSITGWADVARLGVEGRRMLDLGCASGALLVLARENGAARVKGIELDDQIAAHGRREYAVDIAVGEVSHLLAAEPDVFDIVSAFDLVEHVKDPAALFWGVARVLAPGGRFACSVPNGECIDRWGVDWIGINENMEHLHYFRRADLARIGNAVGLKLDRIESRGFPLRLRAYARAGGWAANVLNEPAVALSNAYAKARHRFLGQGTGHELSVVFIKGAG